MDGNFTSCLDFTMLPGNDGQALHTDTGGATSWGVTRATWSRWVGHSASVSEMESVTELMVAPLYKAWFWNTISGDGLTVGVDLMVFDMGITCGEHGAACQLQQVLQFAGSAVDGDIGPKTLVRLNEFSRIDIIELMGYRQKAFYESCATFPINGKGWFARVDRRVTAAKAMVPPIPPPTTTTA
jgi:lysozyme family protein